MRDLTADADQLINNPAHREALDRIEKDICKRIARSEFDGSEQAERYREKLNLLLHLQQRYKAMLVQMISVGKIEENLIQHKTRFRKGL